MLRKWERKLKKSKLKLLKLSFCNNVTRLQSTIAQKHWVKNWVWKENLKKAKNKKTFQIALFANFFCMIVSITPTISSYLCYKQLSRTSQKKCNIDVKRRLDI